MELLIIMSKYLKAGLPEMPLRNWNHCGTLLKTFPPDHGGQVEMKTPTRLNNKTNTA